MAAPAPADPLSGNEDAVPSPSGELAEILQSVQRPGDFYVAGTIELLSPALEVEDVGPIALPLLPAQADQLVAIAEPAPYGRGADTIVDTSVRRTWQIGADRVRVGGRHWQRTLDGIIARACEGLSVDAPVAADLYKLLLYDAGSFFVGHRDTEKVAGMFATLVVALPSQASGGQLILRHQDREVRLDLRADDPAEASFAAFYADCVHEVQPVTAGHRLVLVYNLRRTGGGPLPQPPAYAPEEARLAALLRRWAARPRPGEGGAPWKLVYMLEHAYTPDGLGFAALKGADAAAAAVAVGAAARAGCDVHLALLTYRESGIAEHGGRWSDEEFEAVEVTDREASLSAWRRPDGNALPLGDLPFEAEELSPPTSFEDLEPDDEEFSEATGNEGASFERTYSRAALVLWPGRHAHAVIARAGAVTSLPYLEQLAERWSLAGEDAAPGLRAAAIDLAGEIIGCWRDRQSWDWLSDGKPGNAAAFLTSVTRLRDGPTIERFLTAVPAAGCYGPHDNAAIGAALGLLAADRAGGLVSAIVAANAAGRYGACAGLLTIAAEDPALRPRLLEAATRLAAALPEDAVERDAWGREHSRRIPAQLVVDLITALDAIEPGIALQAAADVAARPTVFPPDSVVIPAVLQLRARPGSQGATAAVERLRRACLDHLAMRIAEPLDPPSDWRRDSALACKCGLCRDLSQFLADGERATWALRAAQEQRRHVESVARQAASDLDLTTHRQGRPHCLVARKNRASYERRAEQRRTDLERQAALAG